MTMCAHLVGNANGNSKQPRRKRAASYRARAPKLQFCQPHETLNSISPTSTTHCRSTQPVMLRASIRSSRAFGHTPSGINSARQWHATQAGRVVSGTVVGNQSAQLRSREMLTMRQLAERFRRCEEAKYRRLKTYRPPWVYE